VKRVPFFSTSSDTISFKSTAEKKTLRNKTKKKLILLTCLNVLLMPNSNNYFRSWQRAGVEFSRSDELSLGDPILPHCGTRGSAFLSGEQQQAWWKRDRYVHIGYAANRFCTYSDGCSNQI
jgi:hypothetical protein